MFKNKNFILDNTINADFRFLISYGGNYELKYYFYRSKNTIFRPHIVAVYQIKQIDFIYGTFLGMDHIQFGLFFSSSSKHIITGITPAFLLNRKKFKFIISFKIFPKLSSNYMFGNDFIIQSYM